MLKTFKWIYNLGVKHERRRVQLLIEQYRSDKPEEPNSKEKWAIENYYRQLSVWHEVSSTLSDLLSPYPQRHQEIQLEPLEAPIDKD